MEIRRILSPNCSEWDEKVYPGEPDIDEVTERYAELIDDIKETASKKAETGEWDEEDNADKDY